MGRPFRRGRGAPQEQAGVRLLSDDPIGDPGADYFGFAKFAIALTEIIDHSDTDTPLTVALSAPWGAGKTSVARMIEGLLAERVAKRDGERPRIVCRFNAWEHDDAPHLGAALAAQVARTANKRRRLWWRLLQPLPGAMLGPQARWRRAILIAIATAALAVALAAIGDTRRLAEQLLHLDTAVVSGFGWLGLLVVAAVLWPVMFSAAKDAARFVDEPSSEAARGSMAQVKAQLGRLIAQATRGGRMVIFVDDLERCRASRAVEVFEVAGQLLAHPGVVTVLLADMRSISKAAEVAYGGDRLSAGEDFGRHYLEKLVQLQLQLPPPLPSDMTLLLRGDPPAGSLPGAGSKPAASPPVALEQVQEWAAYAAVFGFTFALIFSLALGTTSRSALLSTVLDAAALGSIAAALLALGVGFWRRRSRQRRREVEQRVEAALESGESSDGLGDSLSESVPGDDTQSIVDRVAERVYTVRLSEIETVEAFIQSYPPRFPRGAKRMLNHARLLTKIAREREMFGGDPELTPDHLGKWIVLGERWPRLAEEIAARHATIRSEADLLDMLRLEHAPSDQQLTKLLGEPPELHGVVGRLIYFVPASTSKMPPEIESLPDVERHART